MTWVPCGFCLHAPCICAWRTACAPQQYVPMTTGWLKLTPTAPALSDADIERIAKRVAELLKGPASPTAEVDDAGTPPPIGQRAEVSVP